MEHALICNYLFLFLNGFEDFFLHEATTDNLLNLHVAYIVVSSTVEQLEGQQLPINDARPPILVLRGEIKNIINDCQQNISQTHKTLVTSISETVKLNQRLTTAKK